MGAIFFPRQFFRLRTAICAELLLLVIATAVLARPSAMKLFPEETLLLVRTPSAGDMFDRFRDTAMGRMVRDPRIAPLVERLYGTAGDLYSEKFAEFLGVPWEELQNLPRAEVAFAIVARRDFKPAFVLLIDQGERPSVAKTLLDHALERLKEQGGETTNETIEGVDVTVVRQGDNQDRAVGVFEKENTIVAATDPGLLREIVQHWDTNGRGELASASGGAAAAQSQDTDSTIAVPPQYSGRTLAEDKRFVTILRHCRRPHDPPPNLIVYVDPIGLIRQFNRDNAGMAVAMATFPALGVDGLSGIGATVTYATGRYDGLAHLHVLLDNPRTGVMQVVAFEPVDTTPEPWVFADVENYITWKWNVRRSFDVIRSLVDRFQYEGRTDEFVASQINDKFGVDFEREILDNLDGRFIWLTAYEKPAHFRGGKSTLAVKVVDQEAAAKTLQRFVDKYPDRFEARRFGSTTYYASVIEWPEQLRDDPPATPFVAVADGYLFLGSSCQLFERALAAADDTVERLADSPEYQQLAAEALQEAPGVTPAEWMFNRPEETLRHGYDLLTSEKTKAYLTEHAEGNPFFAALSDSLAANELPPFDVLARYATPSVAVLYDTNSGFHGISFSMRAETPEAP